MSEIDVTKCEYYTISGGCMSNEKECWSECCSKNNNCKFKQLERYKQAIEEIFFCLIKENRKGTIKDTIWLNNYITLWDYIAQILAIQGDQNEVENQIIQKCEEVPEL